MLTRFSHVMIYARNHAESVKWYCSKLGYEIDYNAPGENASLHHDRLGRLAIHAASQDWRGGHGAMPYFLCDDIRQTITWLQAAGIAASEPQREGESPWFASFSDPEGNVWGIEEA